MHVTAPTTTGRRVTLINNIFCGNVAAIGDSVACTGLGLADVSYCDAWPGDDPPLRRNYTAETGSECTHPPSPLYLETRIHQRALLASAGMRLAQPGPVPRL